MGSAPAALVGNRVRRACQAGYAPEDAPSSTSQPADFLPRSLEDSLDAMENDHQFLLRGDVFPETLIRRWLEIKRDEINDINRRPHPYEFTMYFDF
jgi:glutamine synthetase